MFYFKLLAISKPISSTSKRHRRKLMMLSTPGEKRGRGERKRQARGDTQCAGGGSREPDWIKEFEMFQAVTRLS